MKIHGLQKMTLLDFPGKVACTVFLGGCDLRCPFCHNAELIDGTLPAIMDEQELLAFLKKRQGLLDGVAITGGEPMLQGENLISFTKEIKDLGYLVKMDTNGTHPNLLCRIIDMHLIDYVAMDVKNSPERYAETTGMNTINMNRIRDSVALLLQNRVEYEFRTTVVAELHNEESFHKIGEWIQGANKYYLQKFINRDTVPFQDFHAPTNEQMLTYLTIAKQYIPSAELRGVDL
jgi:pyruvate formate lyase activating enzyme